MARTNGKVPPADQAELPGYEQIPDEKVCRDRPGRKAHNLIQILKDPYPWCTYCGFEVKPK